MPTLSELALNAGARSGSAGLRRKKSESERVRPLRPTPRRKRQDQSGPRCPARSSPRSKTFFANIVPELRDQSGLRVNVEPYGPDETVVARAASELRQHKVVREHLKNGYRLMSFRLVDEDAKEVAGIPEPSRRFVAKLFEYKNNQALVVSGSLDDLAGAVAVPSGS